MADERYAELKAFLEEQQLESVLDILERNGIKNLKHFSGLTPEEVGKMGVPFGVQKYVVAATKEAIKRLAGPGITEIHSKYIKKELELGRGAFGKVFGGKWHDGKRETKIALKQIIDAKDEDAARREAVCQFALDHESIVKCFGYTRLGDGKLYIVMERMNMGSLDDMLKSVHDREGRLPLKQMVVWCRQACDALVYLHGQKPRRLTHRDVRAENCFVEKNVENGVLRIVLGDFGLSRYLVEVDDAAKEEEEEEERKVAEAEGGRPGIKYRPYDVAPDARVPMWWCSPEVLGDKKVYVRSDVWMLGMLIWEILTGATDFPMRSLCKGKGDNAELLKLLKEGERPVLPAFVDDYLPGLRRLLEHNMWAGKPGDRFHAPEVLKDLDKILAFVSSAPGMFSSAQCVAWVKAYLPAACSEDADALEELVDNMTSAGFEVPKDLRYIPATEHVVDEVTPAFIELFEVGRSDRYNRDHLAQPGVGDALLAEMTAKRRREELLLDRIAGRAKGGTALTPTGGAAARGSAAPAAGRGGGGGGGGDCSGGAGQEEHKGEEVLAVGGVVIVPKPQDKFPKVSTVLGIAADGSTVKVQMLGDDEATVPAADVERLRGAALAVAQAAVAQDIAGVIGAAQDGASAADPAVLRLVCVGLFNLARSGA